MNVDEYEEGLRQPRSVWMPCRLPPVCNCSLKGSCGVFSKDQCGMIRALGSAPWRAHDVMSQGVILLTRQGPSVLRCRARAQRDSAEDGDHRTGSVNEVVVDYANIDDEAVPGTTS